MENPSGANRSVFTRRLVFGACVLGVVAILAGHAAFAVPESTYNLKIHNCTGEAITVSHNEGNDPLDVPNGQTKKYTFTFGNGAVLEARGHRTGRWGSEGIGGKYNKTFSVTACGRNSLCLN